MIRQDAGRIDAARRRAAAFDPRRKQFATPAFEQHGGSGGGGNHEYAHRLNMYDTPPTAEITLEQFEQWAIDRLRSTFYFHLLFFLSVYCLFFFKNQYRFLSSSSPILPRPPSVFLAAPFLSFIFFTKSG
jgi:hypothetical protein